MVASWLLMRAFLPPRSIGVLMVGLLTFSLGFVETVVVAIAFLRLWRHPSTRTGGNFLHVGFYPVNADTSK